MKLTYITLTAYTLYLIRVKMASSYDRCAGFGTVKGSSFGGLGVRRLGVWE